MVRISFNSSGWIKLKYLIVTNDDGENVGKFSGGEKKKVVKNILN